MIIENNSILISKDDCLLNRISVQDFFFDNFIDYNVNVISSDGIDEKISVDWYLYPTDNLIKIADELRKSKGFLPMFSDNTNDYDSTGWYNFYLTVEGDLSDSKNISELAYELYFSVATDLANDDGECYSIVLSESFTNEVVSFLEQDCNIHFESFLQDEYLECYLNYKD